MATEANIQDVSAMSLPLAESIIVIKDEETIFPQKVANDLNPEGLLVEKTEQPHSSETGEVSEIEAGEKHQESSKISTEINEKDENCFETQSIENVTKQLTDSEAIVATETITKSTKDIEEYENAPESSHEEKIDIKNDGKTIPDGPNETEEATDRQSHETAKESESENEAPSRLPTTAKISDETIELSIQEGSLEDGEPTLGEKNDSHRPENEAEEKKSLVEAFDLPKSTSEQDSHETMNDFQDNEKETQSAREDTEREIREENYILDLPPEFIQNSGQEERYSTIVQADTKLKECSPVISDSSVKSSSPDKSPAENISEILQADITEIKELTEKSDNERQNIKEMQIEDVEAGGDKIESIKDINVEEPGYDVENEGAEVSTSVADELNLDVHEEKSYTEISSLDQHLEKITDQLEPSEVILESIVKDEYIRSNKEEAAGLEYNEQATNISKTNLGLANEALIPNFDLKTKSQGEEDEDTDTAIHVEDELNKICLSGVQNQKVEMPSVLEGKWKDPESVGTSHKLEDASTVNSAQSPFAQRVEESTFVAASRNEDNNEEKSENQSSNLVTDGASTQVERQEIDVLSADRKAKEEDSVCLNRDVREAHEEGLTESNFDGEREDGESRDSWEKNELVEDLEEQVSLIPENTEIATPRVNAEKGVEQSMHPAENLDEQEKDEPISTLDTRETSISTEESLPSVESISKIKSEETIFPEKITNDLITKDPLAGERVLQDGGEIGEFSNTEAEENHQESITLSTENADNIDEYHSKTQSTEAITKTIAKSKDDTEVLEKVPESYLGDTVCPYGNERGPNENETDEGGKINPETHDGGESDTWQEDGQEVELEETNKVLSKDVETGGDNAEAINEINIQESDHEKEHDGAKISSPACDEEPSSKVHEEENSVEKGFLDQHLEVVTDQHASLSLIPESIENDAGTTSKGEEDAQMECNDQATSISNTNLVLVSEVLLPNLDFETESQGEEDERVIESCTKGEDTDTTMHVEDESKAICLVGVQKEKSEMASVAKDELKDPEAIELGNKLEHSQNKQDDATTENVAEIPYIPSLEESSFEAASKNEGNDNDRGDEQDGGKRDLWQKNEQEVERGEQIIPNLEKIDIAPSREDAEERVEQGLHRVEKIEEKEEKDGGETSLSTEKSLPLAESITEIKSEETIFPQNAANVINSKGLLVEETAQLESCETGEVSKTKAEEKHQESSMFSTENNEQDEHCFETQSTENLVTQHTDSEAMVATERITKSTQETEELENGSEAHSEAEVDIKGVEKTMPEEPKGMEEATNSDEQSHETAEKQASENEAPSGSPTTTLISDETIEEESTSVAASINGDNNEEKSENQSSNLTDGASNQVEVQAGETLQEASYMVSVGENKDIYESKRQEIDVLSADRKAKEEDSVCLNRDVREAHEEGLTESNFGGESRDSWKKNELVEDLGEQVSLISENTEIAAPRENAEKGVKQSLHPAENLDEQEKDEPTSTLDTRETSISTEESLPSVESISKIKSEEIIFSEKITNDLIIEDLLAGETALQDDGEIGEFSTTEAQENHQESITLSTENVDNIDEYHSKTQSTEAITKTIAKSTDDTEALEKVPESYLGDTVCPDGDERGPNENETDEGGKINPETHDGGKSDMWQKDGQEVELEETNKVLSKDVETGGDNAEAINEINIQETEHEKEHDGAKISSLACDEEPSSKVHEEENSVEKGFLDQHLEVITDQHASLSLIPESREIDAGTTSKGEEDAQMECNDQATSISNTNCVLVSEVSLPNLDLKTKSQGEEDERVIDSCTKGEDTDTTMHVEDESKAICLVGVQNEKSEMASVPKDELKDPEAIELGNKLEHSQNRQDDATTENVAEIPFIPSLEESTFEAASKYEGNDNDRGDHQDAGKRDSWQKNEQEVECEEQIILNSEKTDIAPSREDAEERVEQDLQPVEKIEEKGEKDGGETSLSTEKSLPLAESIKEIKSEETIFPQNAANDLNSKGLLVEETAQLESCETGEVSKTEAEERHQESSMFSTENNEQDEHCFETQSTENLVALHTDSEAMVATERITKSTKETEELENGSEAHSEAKVDIKGDEKTMPEEPQETEEATNSDEQSHETAEKHASENEAPSRSPTTALISDETIELSTEEEESLMDGESTSVDKNDSQRPENVAEEKHNPVEAFDKPEFTGKQDACKKQITEGSIDDTMNDSQDNEKEIQSSREDTGIDIKVENNVLDLPPEFIQNSEQEERYSTAVQSESPKECSPVISGSSVESSSQDTPQAQNICRSETSQGDRTENEGLTEKSDNEKQNEKEIQIEDVDTEGDKVEATKDKYLEEPGDDKENEDAKISTCTAEEINLEVHEEKISAEISSLDQNLEQITDQQASFEVIPENTVKDENIRSNREEDAELEYSEQATSISKTIREENASTLNSAQSLSAQRVAESTFDATSRNGDNDNDKSETQSSNLVTEGASTPVEIEAGETLQEASYKSNVDEDKDIFELEKQKIDVHPADRVAKEEDSVCLNRDVREAHEEGLTESIDDGKIDEEMQDGENRDSQEKSEQEEELGEQASLITEKTEIAAPRENAEKRVEQYPVEDFDEQEKDQPTSKPDTRETSISTEESLPLVDSITNIKTEETIVPQKIANDLTSEDPSAGEIGLPDNGEIGEVSNTETQEKHQESSTVSIENDNTDEYHSKIQSREDLIIKHMSSEAIANTVATSTDDTEELEMVSDSVGLGSNVRGSNGQETGEDGKFNLETQDEGNKDTWQKNEREVDLEEQKILIPEKTDIEDSSENAECGVELNKQLSEKIEETEKKDESTSSQDTGETSVSIEKDLPLEKSITDVKSEETIFSRKIPDDLHSEGPLTEETGQPHNGEIGKVSKTEAQEKQESSNSSTQNYEQDENHSEMRTENLVIKHLDSEAMVTTENQKENEEVTDKQSPETAKESAPEDEDLSRLPTTTLIKDENEKSIEEVSLNDGESTLVETTDSHRSKDDADGKKKAVEAFDLPESTDRLDTCEPQIVGGSVDETMNNLEDHEKDIQSSRKESSGEITEENYIPDLPHQFTQLNSEVEERYSSIVQLESSPKGYSPAECESSVESSSQDKSGTENISISEQSQADKTEHDKLTGISQADKAEVIKDINTEVPDNDMENDVSISMWTSAEEPNLKLHEEETSIDQHESFKGCPESIVNDENTRSKGEEEVDLGCNEQATSISETNLGKINEASLTNLDLTTKSGGDEDVRVRESCTIEDNGTTIQVEDEFDETNLTAEQNKKEEISSAFKKDPELRSSNELEHDTKSENSSLNLEAEAGETLQNTSYSACKDKNNDIYESKWQEIDVPPAEDSVCPNRDLRGTNEEEITQMEFTEINEDGRCYQEPLDVEKRDSRQNNEQEVELEEVILIPEKREMGAPRVNDEKGVEQNIQNLEKIEEREEKDEPTSTPDTRETSISTEKSLPIVESFTQKKSEESNSNYLLVEEAGQPDSDESGKVPKIDYEEECQELSKFGTENYKQDEYHSEAQRTEDLVIKHTNSEAMLATESITKSTKDNEELEKVPELNSEEKLDIKGDETIIPEEPKEIEEATDRKIHTTAKERLSEDETPSKLPISIGDETAEQSFQEESLKDGGSTLIEKNEIHRPENDAEENIKAVEVEVGCNVLDIPKTTSGENTSKQQVIEGPAEETINNFQDNEKEIESSREETGREVEGKYYVPDLPPEFIKNTEQEHLTTVQLDSSQNECSSAESKESMESSCPDKSPIENISTSDHFQADRIEDESQDQNVVPSRDVETNSNEVEAITDKSIGQDQADDIKNDGAKPPRLSCAEEPKPKVHEEEITTDIISLDQRLEPITDEHSSSTVIPKSTEKDMTTRHTNEITRSKGEEDVDLASNEQALLPNLDLKTESQGEEEEIGLESYTKNEDTDTTIQVEDEFNELSLAGVHNKKAEIPSVLQGEWKDPESIKLRDKLEDQDNKEEEASKLNLTQDLYVHRVEESNIEAASKNEDQDDDKSENPSSGVVTDEASTHAATEASETLQEASYTACQDKDIHESVWKEVDIPPVDRMPKAEDSTCPDRDVRRTNEEEIIQNIPTESEQDSKISPEKHDEEKRDSLQKDDLEDSKINLEKHDGEKKDSWQKDEEDELGEQVILIPEKAEMASQTEVAEKRVEELSCKKEVKNDRTSTPDTREASISTEKSLSPVESITEIRGEELISPQITANDLDSTYPLVEGTSQPDSSEIDEISKMEPEEKPQEPSKLSTENNRQDEHFSETQSTENLVMKHTDFEGIVTTETITNSTKDTEELKKVTESHFEEKADIKGDGKIIPEQSKEMEEATEELNEANATNSGLVGQTEKIDLEERESRTLENLAEANDNFSSLTATESPEEGIHNESEKILYRKSSMGSQGIEKDYKAEIFNKEVTYILDTPLSMHERKDVTITDNILDKSSNSEDSGDKQIPEIESDSVSGGQSIIHESTRTEKSEVPVAEKMLEPDNLGKFESTSNKAHEEVRASGEVIQLEPHEEGDKEYIDTLIKESEGIKQATVSDEAAHLKTVERDFEFVQEVHCYEVFTELVDKEKHTKTELSHPEENQYETTTAAGKTTNTQVSDEKKSEAIEIGDHEHIKDDLPVDIKGKNVTEAGKSLIRENEGTETIIAGETEVMARGTKEPSVTVNRSQKGHTDKVEVSEYTKEIEKLEDSSWETVDINLTEKADVDTRKNNEEDVQERPQNQDEETKREVQVREESNLQRSTEEHQLEEATPKTTQSEEAKIDSEIDEDENRKIEPLSGASAMVETSADKDVKVAHKKSHNILSGVGSKVKHSISKVKKAITGKSSHPKTASPK